MSQAHIVVTEKPCKELTASQISEMRVYRITKVNDAIRGDMLSVGDQIMRFKGNQWLILNLTKELILNVGACDVRQHTTAYHCVRDHSVATVSLIVDEDDA